MISPLRRKLKGFGLQPNVRFPSKKVSTVKFVCHIRWTKFKSNALVGAIKTKEQILVGRGTWSITLRETSKSIFIYLCSYGRIGMFCLFFFIFVLLKQKFNIKNCRLLRDSNLDCRSRKQARWPFGQHHGTGSACLPLTPKIWDRISQKPTLIGRSKIFYQSKSEKPVQCKITLTIICIGPWSGLGVTRVYPCSIKLKKNIFESRPVANLINILRS